MALDIFGLLKMPKHHIPAELASSGQKEAFYRSVVKIGSSRSGRLRSFQLRVTERNSNETDTVKLAQRQGKREHIKSKLKDNKIEGGVCVYVCLTK